MSRNANYSVNSFSIKTLINLSMSIIQVPFEVAVQDVLEQLKKIAKGDYKTPISERRKSATIVFAAVSLPVQEIQNLLDTVSEYV